MPNYWGMKFVEVIDPKQPEGTRPDAITHALLTTDGYYQRLQEQCYSEQFVNVFYQAIIAPVLDYLDRQGIAPEVVSVERNEVGLAHNRMVVLVDDFNFEVQVRYHELEQMDFPQRVGGWLSHQIQRNYERKAAQYLYNLMTPQQHDYLNEVVEARGFDNMDRVLYLNPHFQEFLNRGLITRNGMYYCPSEQMIRIWQMTRE